MWNNTYSVHGMSLPIICILNYPETASVLPITADMTFTISTYIYRVRKQCIGNMWLGSHAGPIPSCTLIIIMVCIGCRHIHVFQLSQIQLASIMIMMNQINNFGCDD
jgi:hypothetical protein